MSWPLAGFAAGAAVLGLVVLAVLVWRGNGDGEEEGTSAPSACDPGQLANYFIDVAEHDQASYRGMASSTVNRPTGDAVTVLTDDGTQWHGQVRDVRDIQDGMRLQTIGRWQEDCSLLAVTVLSPSAGSFSSVVFVDEDIGWVSGTRDGGSFISATTDGGETWDEQYTAERSIGGLQFVDALSGWAVIGPPPASDASTLLRTIDGGETWTEASLIAGTNFEFITPTLGRAITVNGLAETNDGGLTWSVVPTSTSLSAVCFGDANLGFGVAGARIARTDDGGRTWVPTEGTGNELQCSGTQDVWVRSPGPFVGGTLVNYVLWYSGDGGTDWNPVLGDQSIGPLATATLTSAGPQPGPWTVGDSADAYFVGRCMPCETSTLVVTHDGGATWSDPVELVALRRAAAISFSDELHGWAVGTTVENYLIWPVVVHTTDGGQTWEQQYP